MQWWHWDSDGHEPRQEAKEKVAMTIMVGIRNVHGAYAALTRNLLVVLGLAVHVPSAKGSKGPKVAHLDRLSMAEGVRRTMREPPCAR